MNYFSALKGLIAAFLVLPWAAGCQKEEKAAAPSPPAVEVVEVVQKDVPVIFEWVGTLDGLVNATIRAQVTGYLIKQNYRDGNPVKKGQLLFEIDPRIYKAALDQAEGALAQYKAALDQSKAGLEQARAEVSRQEARWETAKANLNRIRPLAEQNAVSQKDLDDAVGAELTSRSSVDAAKAAVVAARAAVGMAQSQVIAAQAAVEKAALDLSFTKVSSPIDGISGIARAQIGDLVGPGSTEELTTVSTVDPIKVYISVSEQEYLKASEKQQAERGKASLEMILADGSVYPQKGEMAFADRQVDVRTGTIRVAATFPNPNNLLRPGQFSRIRAEMGVKKGALVIPQRAVTEFQGRYLVGVVGPENKVAIKPVKVGERVGSLWVIEEGLQAGEKVVAEGTQKVKQDMVVSPKPFEGQAPAGHGTQKPEVKPEPRSKKG